MCDDKIIYNTYAFLLTLQGTAGAGYLYVYIYTCMYVYVCIFIGDAALSEAIGTKTRRGCPGDDLLLSSCLNTSEFPLLRLIN